jgi:THO complex subunit 4
LDPSVGADDIKEIFQNLGNVVKAVVFYDQERRSLGSAEVTFGNTVTATRAVEEYDGAEVDGRPMTLKLLSGVAPPPKNVVTKRRERVTQPTQSAPRERSYGITREDRRDREDRGERPARRPSRGGATTRYAIISYLLLFHLSSLCLLAYVSLITFSPNSQ